MSYLSEINRKIRQERIDAMHPDVRDVIKQLNNNQADVYQYIGWSCDPDEKDPDWYPQRLIEAAHELLDIAHAFRAAVKAHPPVKVEEEDLP